MEMGFIQIRELAVTVKGREAAFAAAAASDNTRKNLNLTTEAFKRYFCPFFFLSMFVYLCSQVTLEIYLTIFSFLK